jgi:hypothetical protein
MEKRGIGVALLALVFLACAGNGGSQDARSSATDTGNDGNSLVIPLPPYEVSPAPDVPRCECRTWASPCPGDAAACVDCQDSPAYCAECPVPSAEVQTCTTVGLHCEYGGPSWCDCMAVEGGPPVWVCVACPC